MLSASSSNPHQISFQPSGDVANSWLEELGSTSSPTLAAMSSSSAMSSQWIWQGHNEISDFYGSYTLSTIQGVV